MRRGSACTNQIVGFAEATRHVTHLRHMTKNPDSDIFNNRIRSSPKNRFKNKPMKSKSKSNPFRFPAISGAAIVFACFTLLHIKAQATDAFFIGNAGDHNLTTGSNWVGGTAAGDWDRLIFGSAVVDGTLDLNNYNGRSGITLTGLVTQNITINGPQPLIMGAITSDAGIDMSVAAANLTINAQYQIWDNANWNIGTGRTLSVNGGVHENVTHSITKNGAGTARITAASSYTGGTTISGGTLEIGGAGTLGNGSYAGDISIAGALVYNSSANQILSGIITGSGSITKNGSGTLTLTQATNGYPAHLFDGAITINSGTLVAADLYFGLNFTSSITVNGGTLNVQTAPSEQGNLYLNGGTVTSTGLADASYGNILLSQNSTLHAGGAAVSTISVNQVNLWGANSIDVGASSTLNITSVVAEYGPAGLNKTGAGTLALSGANTYSGNTTVTGGTLSLGQVNPNNESSTVSITASAGAKLDLAFIGTDTVGSLFINGVQQPAGNYTSAHASGAFTGGGTLTVASGPAGYASWKAVNAPIGTPSDDYDGDGVGNGSEYVLGGTKDTNDLSKLPAVSTSGTNLLFTFQRAQASIDGTTNVAIQVSTNLSTWPVSYNVPGVAQANNPGVTVVKNTSAGFDTVTLTVPRAPDQAKFARLVVTPAP